MLELNKIYNMDCIEGLSFFNYKEIDLILTDPPYGVNHADWDKKMLSLDWFYLALTKAKTVAFTPGHKFMYKYPEPDCIISVVRPGSMQLQKKGGKFSHWEPVLVYGERLPNPDTVIIKANTNASKYGHPCAKSLKLFEWLLLKLSNEDELVVDPFCGSGTTAIACKKLRRSFIGIDINKEYVEMSKMRLYNVPIRLDEFQT